MGNFISFIQKFGIISFSKIKSIPEYKSKESSFTAQSKPSVSQVKVYEISPYSARVSVKATKETEASFNYGEGTSFDLKAGGDTLAKEHELTLENLKDNTTYTYYVDVKDPQGNTARSEQGTFKTPLDTEPPVLSDIKLSPLTGSDESKRGVIITWVTDKPSTSQVAYSAGVIAGTYNQKTPKEEALTQAHTVLINNLDPGTTYHFQLVSQDQRGNVGESADYTMITQEEQESILELILKTLEDTFSWVGKIGEFFGDAFSQIFSF